MQLTSRTPLRMTASHGVFGAGRLLLSGFCSDGAVLGVRFCRDEQVLSLARSPSLCSCLFRMFSLGLFRAGHSERRARRLWSMLLDLPEHEEEREGREEGGAAQELALDICFLVAVRVYGLGGAASR